MTRMFMMSLIAVGVLCVAACSDSAGTKKTNEDPTDEATAARRAALESIAQRVILTTYNNAANSAQALEQAATAWAAAPNDAAKHDAARAAWREAIAAWQQAELLQLGPAGDMGETVGAEGIRAEIYSWPLVNRCRVDQEIVTKKYEDEAAFGTLPINVRGLDALEYLLFFDGTTNACAPNAAINAQGLWAAIPAAELPARRATYARTLARDLVKHTSALKAAWAADGGGFVTQLTTAGSGSMTYPSTQEALNAISDAMFYLDKEVKDMKLARPAAIMGCETDCASFLESSYADASAAHLLNNLRGFRAVYHGGDRKDPEARGFDDLLRGVGAAALADKMDADIEAAIVAIEAIGPSMRMTLDSNPEKIVAAHTAVRKITDSLKTQFVAVLDLELPKRAEGDND